MPTEFGTTVLAASATEATVDGIPLEDFIVSEQEARTQGQTLLTNDDGTPFDPLNPSKGEAPRVGQPLLGNPNVEPLPLLRGQMVRPARADDNAKDIAQIETLAEGNPEEYQSRVEANAKGAGAFDENGSIENATIAILRSQFEQELITHDPGFDFLDSDTPEEKFNRLSYALTKADIQKMTQLQYVATRLFLAGGGELPASVAGEFSQRFSGAEIDGMMRHDRDMQSALGRRIIDGFVAAQGWETWEQATADVAIQELTPVYNVMSKVGLLQTIAGAAGIPEGDQPKFLLGEGRQKIRETLVAMNPTQRAEALEAIVREVTKLQSDPKMGPFLRTFNVLEQFEAIFNEDVIMGNTAKDSWDRFFGNFESAVEALFTVAVIVRVGSKGLKGTFRAFDASRTTRAARNTAARRFQAEVQNVLQGKLATEMGIDAGEAEASILARPGSFVDERTISLPGVREATERADRLEGELLRTVRGRLSRVLTTVDKSQAVARELDKVQLGDHAVIAPAMSTVTELPDGAAIRAVIAKNGESGWSNFDELLPDLLSLDPNLEQLTLLRRGTEGNLVPVSLTPEELARIATTDVKVLSDADLIAKSGKAEAGSLEFLTLEREAARRAGSPRTVDEILGDEFFLEYEHFRAWHPTDKRAFGETALRNTSIPSVMLTPNAKFGDEIIGSFQESYNIQERAGRLFEGIYQDFYTLSVKDKRVVSGIYEWSEDWAKKHNRAPDLFDVTAEFGDLTPKQYAGLVALRRGLDAQYEVFNRRLYLEWQAQGFKTARPTDPELARYHGKPLSQEAAGRGVMYDPIKQEAVKLDEAEMATLYNDGGTILELDVPIDVPGTSGTQKSTKIVVDGNDYQIGDLSTRPLEYYPGYNFRFYEDPYFINKNQTGVAVDGKIRPSTEVDTTAIKTAGSQLEAERFLHRIAQRVVDEKGNVRWVDREDPSVTYDFQRSRDINQTETTFRQKQSLQREGRLFWDQRNRDRLMDVNGNQSELMDFVQALERGTGLAARVNAEEDIMRAVKNAFAHDYSDLVNAGDISKKDIKAIISDLQAALNNAPSKEAQVRIEGAIEIAKYIRQMEGVDAATIPFMRRQVLRAAVWADRMLNNKGFKAGSFSGVEKWAQKMDPIRAARSVAFQMFMVFRPFRQALLQMSQPMFLAGLDPSYVVSGRGLWDSFALRRGFIRLNDSGWDDGYSAKWLAARMGLKEKEYRLLVKEFDRSGVVDVVDVHSFTGGTRRYNKVALPRKETASSTAFYGARVAGTAIVDTLKKIGFDFGERMNKIGTYNIAWRRLLKSRGYKSILEFTDEDWKQVRLDTENLSLAMSRPNNAVYQSGLLSVTTQFLSFTHKVALAMMGQNPAIKGKDVVKLWAGMFTLFGANVFGARDLTREQLTSLGLGEILDEQLPDGSGATVIDLLSAGLVQTMVNKVGNISSEDWKDIDTENFTPVLNVKQFWEMNIEAVVKNPETAIMGPFGNRVSAGIDSLQFAQNVVNGMDLPPADKLTKILHMTSINMLPQYKDFTMSLLGHEMLKLYHATGESIQLQPTWNTLLARGFFGARSMEEIAYYRFQDKIRDDDAIVRDMIMQNRTFLKQYIFLFRKGEISQDMFHDAARIVGELAKMAPPGRVEEVIQGSMLTHFADDDPLQTPTALLAEAITDQKLTAAAAKDLVNQLVTDEQARARLHMWIDDSYDERKYNQEQLRQRMIEMNPNLEDN